jgi:hypothetical protein
MFVLVLSSLLWGYLTVEMVVVVELPRLQRLVSRRIH